MAKPEETKAAAEKKIADDKAAEEAVMIGGPGQDINAPAQQVMDTTPATVEPEKAPVYTGLGGDLGTQEELIAYTRTLEKDKFDRKLAESKAEPVPAETPAVAESETATHWYTDPDKAERSVINKAKKELRAELDEQKQKETDEKNFYTELYEENPDLKPMERLVKSVINEKWDTIKVLHASESKKFIAKEVRAFASDLRAAGGVKGTELPQGQVITTGSSGTTPPAPTETLKVLNFSEQLKQMQAGKQVNG